MRLLTPLATGFADAASGTVSIKVHNTTTNAVTYEDFDGTSVTGIRALDASGRIILYADSIVDVVVYDSHGATVASFTDAGLAQGVELRNAGWTGSYPDGSVAAGGSTDLNTALNLLYLSLGTTDGKVLVGGVATNIKDAIAAAQTSVYFNVVSDYNATGSGSTDDSPFFQAALTAAGLVGGTVIVPQATSLYLINTSLTVPVGVNILGVGAGSYLKGGTGVTQILNPAGNNVIANLKLGIPSTEVGVQPTAAITTGCKIINCLFTGSAATIGGTGVKVSTACRNITLIGNTFSTLTYGLNITDTLICDGVMVVGNYYYDAVISACGSFTGNTFIGTTSSGANGVLLSVPNVNGHCDLSANQFEGLSTQYALSVAGSATISSAGNTYDTLHYVSQALAPTLQTVRWPDRDIRYTTAALTVTTSYTPGTEYGVHVVNSATSAMAFTIPSSFAYEGAVIDLRYKNTFAGNVTPTFVTSGSFGLKMPPGAIIAVPQNTAQYWRFRYTNSQWLMMSTSGTMSIV